MSTGLFQNNSKYGICRVCGKEGALSNEHIIPRRAGGGRQVSFYSPTDIIEDKKKGKETTRRLIKQNGICDYTLCKECNERIGHAYDVPFSDFLRLFNYAVSKTIIKEEKSGHNINDFINKGCISFELKEIMPFNIAKRILASFCSVENYLLTDLIPDIRTAILNESFKPSIKDFSIYLCVHIGDDAFFSGLSCVLKNGDLLKYSSIEYGYVGIYFMLHDGVSKPLDGCVDITNWLTRYSFNQKGDITFTLPMKSMIVPVKVPRKK